MKLVEVTFSEKDTKIVSVYSKNEVVGMENIIDNTWTLDLKCPKNYIYDSNLLSDDNLYLIDYENKIVELLVE